MLVFFKHKKKLFLPTSKTNVRMFSRIFQRSRENFTVLSTKYLSHRYRTFYGVFKATYICFFFFNLILSQMYFFATRFLMICSLLYYNTTTFKQDQYYTVLDIGGTFTPKRTVAIALWGSHE